jgi:uncharacterized protein YpmB
MSSRPLTPPSLPSPEEFRPDKFKKKSNARDYVVYAVVLIVVIGVIGGSVYYFTRSKAEKDKLHAKLDNTMTEAGLRSDPPEPPPKLKDPKLGGLLGEEEAEAKAAAAAAKKAEATKAEGLSTYSGGGPNRVMLSSDPNLPKASIAFIQFAEDLKVSSVVQGTAAKVMIAGKLFRSGDVIDSKQGVTFVGVDRAKTALILRDDSGAELFLSY